MKQGVWVIAVLFSQTAVADTPSALKALIDQHCVECHDDASAKGDLDLLALPFEIEQSRSRLRWVQIHDRIDAGEMPPPEKAENFTEDDRKAMLKLLSDALLQADRVDIAANGRGPLRRLTRGEYENNLRDLLTLPHLDIRDRLPEDRNADGFTKAAATLDMSRVQLNAYLDAAEAALRQAVASGVRPEEAVEFRAVGTDLFSTLNTFGGREAMFFAKAGMMVEVTNDDVKSGEPDAELELAIFRSATWPYYGYPRHFRAKYDGAYRVRFSARAVRQVRDFRIVPAHESLTMTFRARQPSGPDVSGDVRSTGGWIDILPEPETFETTIRLKAGETFEYSLLGLPVPHPITSHGGPLYYDFPPMPDGGHPGVAIQWLEVAGPITEDENWPPESHRALFGDLSIRPAAAGARLAVEVVSEDSTADAGRLLRDFGRRAARGPVPDEAFAPYLGLIFAKLDGGALFAEAMLHGYQAFLCSGDFLYLQEPSGSAKAARFAIASRLSHFLWNSRPDAGLEAAAAEGALRDPEALRVQVDRLVADPRFERFVRNFTDEWLDLRELRRDLPDIRLYPEYRKDDYLVDSMELETRAFFAMLVRENLPVATIADADFAFINDRLARHYDLAPVAGSAVRRVELPEWSPYGGLLTQASILKVTANGTTTSPVLRGAWVMEKLIGDPPPPPPTSVPAIEPDIRGAATIQQLLAKHTEAKSCAGCHARFDPVGFALENFDIMGAWRDRYRGLENGEKITGIDRAGHAFIFHVAHPVEPAGKLRSGETFRDIRELKSILAANPRQLARNLLQQFTLYATGTPTRFSNRPQIEAILDHCEPGGYRVADLLHGLIQSPFFLGTPQTP